MEVAAVAEPVADAGAGRAQRARRAAPAKTYIEVSDGSEDDGDDDSDAVIDDESDYDGDD